MLPFFNEKIKSNTLITASPDITNLEFSVKLDMSTEIPSVSITNLSTIVNLGNLQWVFELRSPSQDVHIGSFTTPDVNGVAFTTFTFPETLPQYFNQLEFDSSRPYSVKAIVKDSNQAEFSLTHKGTLCKPNNNDVESNFGDAKIGVQVKCASAQLLVTDKTDTLYKGIVGTSVSTTVQLDYPKDKAGNSFIKSICFISN